MSKLKLWYMRDNHTFRSLPLDLEQALVVLKEEFDAGFKYGMLSSKPNTADIHARGDFETFATSVLELWPTIILIGEEHYQMSLDSRKYTLEEVKAAFWETFHEAGEVWFSYQGNKELNEDCTNGWFTQFVEALDPERVAEGDTKDE